MRLRPGIHSLFPDSFDVGREFAIGTHDYERKLAQHLAQVETAPQSSQSGYLRNLANFYYFNLRFVEAEETYAKVKTGSTTEQADILRRRADMMRCANRLPEAKKLLEDTVKMLLEQSYQYTGEIANTYMLLGDLQAALNNWQDAEDSYAKVEKYVPSGYEVSDYLSRVGNLFYFQDKFEEAEIIFQKSLEARNKNDKIGHANDWRGLMRIYDRRGDIQPAAEFIKEHWAHCSQRCDRAHPDKAAAALLMARLSATENDAAAAGGFLWKAYKLYGLRYGIFGDDCFAVLEAAGSMSNVVANCNAFIEIKEYFKVGTKLISQGFDDLLDEGKVDQALGFLHSNIGNGATGSTDVAAEIEALNLETIIDLIRGMQEEAEQCSLRARTHAVSLWGENHAYVAEQNLRLGQIYMLIGKPSEAESMFAEAYKINSAVFGSNSKELKDTLNCLRQVYAQTNQLELAVRYGQQLMELESDQQQDVRYYRAAESLADVESMANKFTDAELHYRLASYGFVKQGTNDAVFRITDKLCALEWRRV